MKEIAVIPNNPSQNDALIQLETTGEYKGWAGGLNCIKEVGQLVILYISENIQEYQCLAEITAIDTKKKVFDIKLLSKFDSKLSNKFNRKKLLELGLQKDGVIRYYLNSYPDILKFISDELIAEKIITQPLYNDDLFNVIIDKYIELAKKGKAFLHCNISKDDDFYTRKLDYKDLVDDFLANPTEEKFIKFWNTNFINSAIRKATPKNILKDNDGINSIKSIINEIIQLQPSENILEKLKNMIKNSSMATVEFYYVYHMKDDNFPLINNGMLDGLKKLFSHTTNSKLIDYEKYIMIKKIFDKKYILLKNVISEKFYLIDQLLNLIDKLKDDDITDDNEVNELFDEVRKLNIQNNFKDKNIKGGSMQEAKQIQPLNQILYGPPGTGKTYNTINKALEVIFEKEETTKIIQHTFNEHQLDKTVKELQEILKKGNQTDTDRKHLKTAFDFYKDQIEFVTFHQSYGYEEFVEGIKADLDSDEIKYKLEKGIFKRLCKQAIKQNKITIDLKQINFNDYLKVGQELFTKHGKKITIKKIDEDIVFTNDTGSESIATYKKMIDRLNDESLMLSDDYYSAQVYIAREIYKQLDKKKSVSKNYILIIDEINRGNISKIFGELITLIEPSKRIGADEEIMLKLPNSLEPFGVPSNLYIIGTMNTADRSIAQIDTALRRRFVFEEMMPKPELLVFNNDKNKPLIIKSNDQEGVEQIIEVQKILAAINERIEYIHDREHTIGHSYFMPLINTPTKEKLDEIFKINIIPLLAEYFYGDWGDIVEVLNDDKGNFIKEKELKYKTKTDRKNKVYEISRNFTTCAYIKIYNGKCNEEPNKSQEQNKESVNL